MKSTTVLGLTASIVIMGSLDEVRAQVPREGDSTFQSDALDGFWVTEGYGLLFEIGDGRLQGYEISGISCLQVLSGVVMPPDSDVADADPAVSTEAVVALGFYGSNRMMHVHPGASPDEKWFHPEGAVSSMVARRVAERPAICDSPPGESPPAIFDIVWQTFDEHYPFFELKGMDWAAVRTQYRSRVTPETSDDQLLAALSEMLDPLEDAHVFVETDDGREYEGRRADPDRLTDEERQRTLEIIENEYLTEPLRWYCNDRVAYSRLESDIGYLRVSGFSRYDSGGDWRAGLTALNVALDNAFSDADSLRGLVIDVRLNGGGSDHYTLQIANRLTGSEYLAYTKEALDPADGSWLPGQPSIVLPSERPGFRGPVVLLIGRDSVSAAETFTMALMGREPEIARVGENTQGVFSDVLDRVLPNGWSFGLPNEQFLTEDGVSFDGPGIAPHVAVPVFPRADLDAGRDSAIERALEILR